MAPYPTGRKLTMDKMHRQARAQFGRTAEAYILAAESMLKARS